MTCKQARDVLSADLDGEASPLEQELVQRHLDACSGCQAWIAAAHTRLASSSS